jgi:hypothetical protein
MKKHLQLLVLALLCAVVSMAQTDLYGVVRKLDTTAAPIYQAKVVVYKGFDSLTTLKTYFDGAFKFAIEKNETYTIKASYPGYKDSIVIIKTDKKASPRNRTSPFASKRMVCA